jgi:hypothetical protein
MAAIVDEIENAKTSYNALLLYFGEEGKTGLQPNELFQTISSFCRDFDAAVTVVVETETLQVRPFSKNTNESCIVLTDSIFSCERRIDLAKVLRRHHWNPTRVTGQWDVETCFEGVRRTWVEF